MFKRIVKRDGKIVKFDPEKITEAIAKDCARGNGGAGKDLDLMVTSGSCTIKSVYYEE